MNLIYLLEWLLVLSFLVPLVEVVVALFGCAYSLLFFRRRPEKFTELIIQIASVGKEFDLVQRCIDTINAYELDINYQIWVVIEPGFPTNYQGCERVIVVPEDFTCKPVDKARALEYCRRIRKEEGLNRPDVKILFVDDDTLPSKRYIQQAFPGDYDLCQGITIANRWYAVGSWQHFLMSHLDDPRSRNCLIYCSFNQGFVEYPVFVHGEGLCITGECEDRITWDFPIVGSDDLVFGLNAAELGLRWGFFIGAIQLISPWTWKEHLTQRWRWTWGNIDAIRNKEIMPRKAALLIIFKYLSSFGTVAASTTALVLISAGYVVVPPAVIPIFQLSIVVWVLSYAVPAWISAGGQPNRELRPQAWRYWGFRIVQTLVGSVMTPITAIAPSLVIAYVTLKGRPRKFVMIDKNHSITGV